MKFCLLLPPLFLLAAQAFAAKTENVIIVTLDGMRWQEVFKGIDPGVLKKHKFTKHKKDLIENYGVNGRIGSRERLMPFLWNQIGKNGQLYGSRNLKNNVDVSNPYRFSYPGYSELFTGYPDPAVNSNDKVPNPNDNVFEFINHQPGFENKVAVFATWEVMPYILNRDRSGIFINADRDPFTGARAKALNLEQSQDERPLGVRQDRITGKGAEAYLREFKPRVLYVSLGETDEAAHQGKYDAYLDSAHENDAIIKKLWSAAQSMPEYAGKTTLIVTTDHGRGGWEKPTWTDHGDNDNGPILESSQIWMGFLGPDTEARGEVAGITQIYQKQMAQTIAQFLGLKYESKKHTVSEAIQF